MIWLKLRNDDSGRGLTADRHRRAVLEVRSGDRDARCPPADGPEAGVIVNGRRCENSDVFPEGSVAVMLIRSPGTPRGA